MEGVAVKRGNARRGSVVTASEADRRSVLETLTRAFAADPVVRWVFPEDARFRAAFPLMADAFGGAAIAHRTSFLAGGDAGASLWLPPEAEPDEETMMGVMAVHVAPERLEDIGAVFETLEQYHPEGPHWYLTLIGVTPERQGEGYGSAMLEHALRACDASGLPVFLEATCERNAALYARHGFATVGEVQAGDSPVIRPMVRPAR